MILPFTQRLPPEAELRICGKVDPNRPPLFPADLAHALSLPGTAKLYLGGGAWLGAFQRRTDTVTGLYVDTYGSGYDADRISIAAVDLLLKYLKGTGYRGYTLEENAICIRCNHFSPVAVSLVGKELAFPSFEIPLSPHP